MSTNSIKENRMRAREWRKTIEVMKREHEDLADQLLAEGNRLKIEKHIEADVHTEIADTLGALLAQDDAAGGTNEEEDNGENP